MLWSDLPTNYPWNICFLAHTREERYWPVCSWLLLACFLALSFCPHARASEPLKSVRRVSAFSTSSWLLFTQKKSQQSEGWVPLGYLPTKRTGRKGDFENRISFRSPPRDGVKAEIPLKYLGEMYCYICYVNSGSFLPKAGNERCLFGMKQNVHIHMPSFLHKTNTRLNINVLQ